MLRITKATLPYVIHQMIEYPIYNSNTYPSLDLLALTNHCRVQSSSALLQSSLPLQTNCTISNIFYESLETSLTRSLIGRD